MACEYGGRNQRLKVDRISSLPNELLSLILSFLPTKCAFGTSILSKRWRNLWTSVTSLDFDASPEEESNSDDFTDFVVQVFDKCNSSHMQRFRLHFRSFMADHSDITTWINQATKLMVSEMDIDVYMLPLSIFSCRTLTILKLAAKGYWDDINIPSFYLPCLKVLHIEWKNVWNWPPKALMEKIFGSCPGLEDLTLTGSLGYGNEDEFVVSAPTLKTLRLHLRPCPFRSPSGISSSLAKFRNLTCVEVVTWDPRFWALIPELMKGSPSLKVLSLEQNGPIDNRAWHENVWVKPKSVPNCLGSHLAVIKIKGFKGRKQDLKLLKYCLGNGKVLQRLTINRRGLPIVQEVRFREELLKFSKASVCCQIQFRGNDYPYKSL